MHNFFTVTILAEVYSQQPISWFYSSKLLQVPKGHYVEINFTMETDHPSPCINDMYLEVRDGYNQSANLLGVFCGRNIASILRSSGQNMWLRRKWAGFKGSYSGKTANITGKYCLCEFHSDKFIVFCNNWDKWHLRILHITLLF